MIFAIVNQLPTNHVQMVKLRELFKFQVLKSAITQAKVSREDIDVTISRYMMIFCTTLHTTTGESPSMLLVKKKLRKRLDLLKLPVKCHVENKQNSVVAKFPHWFRCTNKFISSFPCSIHKNRTATTHGAVVCVLSL